MPFMGRRLIRIDPLVRSELIVVLGSSRLERTLEAGVLFREGWAPRILLLRPPDVVRDSLRKQLGLHVPVFLDIEKDALRQMGVPPGAVLESPHTQDSTRTEATAVAGYARQHGLHRIILVTSPYHTGRAASLFRKAARGAFEVCTRSTRYERADPDNWWRRFPDRTDVVFEYLKTVYAWLPDEIIN
jgi:uncharacterized SAM-binding protein YcdF (DUF218 family)